MAKDIIIDLQKFSTVIKDLKGKVYGRVKKLEDAILSPGTVVEVKKENWVQNGSVYTNTVKAPGIAENVSLNASIYNEALATDEQIDVLDKLITDINVSAGNVVFTASSLPTVSVFIILYTYLPTGNNSSTNGAVVTLLASNWVENGTNSYTNTVNVPGISNVSSLNAAIHNEAVSSSEQIEVFDESIVDITVSGDDVLFTANKAITIDLEVVLYSK